MFFNNNNNNIYLNYLHITISNYTHTQDKINNNTEGTWYNAKASNSG